LSAIKDSRRNERIFLQLSCSYEFSVWYMSSNSYTLGTEWGVTALNGIAVRSSKSKEQGRPIYSQFAPVTNSPHLNMRQIRRIRKSLDAGSTATLVHALVTSRVDYCNVVLAESPRSITDKLQRVMNAAARVISNTQKYDSGLSLLRHEELH